LLSGLDQKDLIIGENGYVAAILSDMLEQFAPEKAHADDWDVEGLRKQVLTAFGVDLQAEGVKPEQLSRTELGDAIFEKLRERYEAKEKLIGPDALRYHERMVMLSVLDSQWKDHLLSMDHLKEGIGLRGYGQHDPLVEYKRESFQMFEAMMQRFQDETVRYLYLMQVFGGPESDRIRRGPEEDQGEGGGPGVRVPVPQGGGDGGRRPPRSAATSMDTLEEEFQRRKRRELDAARLAGSGDYEQVQQVVRSAARVGRNDPCPCGSGKKYKKCCGAGA
ncbi:MAG: SEC-C metal-binding domain-containing protein, partial [Terriglobales bacterium]